MRKEFIPILTYFIITLILLQTILLLNLHTTQHNKNLAKSDVTGTFGFCLNFPPKMNLSNCPYEFNQSTSIENNTMTCQIQLSHPLNHTVTITPYYQFNTQNGLLFNLTENGTLTINGNQSSIGLHGFYIFAKDEYECPFTTIEFYQFIIQDINDPPHYIENPGIPDVTLDSGTEIIPFFLDAHFDDVDGDPLTYRYYGDTEITITINNQTSAVTFTSPQDYCETDLIYFEAKDPGNLTADSRIISIESTCYEPPRETPGGGGGVVDICDPNWRCEAWSECFINQTQYRTCTDLHRCDQYNFRKTFWRECEYIASCTDGIQNCHIMPDGSILCEEGIDCGGPCEPCAQEEDEKKEPAATCYDGIQNCHTMPDGSILCEEGIDCGGPCEPCRRIETPGIIIEETAKSIIYVLATIFIILAILTITYLIYRKQILTILAKIGWWLTRKKHKQYLITKEEKEELLKQINQIYKKVYEQKIKEYTRKSKETNTTINISRTYLSKALRIPENFNTQEMRRNAEKKIYNTSLLTGITLYTQSLYPKEKKTSKLTKQELLNFAQETRMLILSTSKLTKEDFNFKAIEQEVKGNTLTKAISLIHNSYLALCFSETITAQQNYYELLNMYEKMNEEEKTKTYYELAKIYHYTKTILSWIE